ncbi:FecR protein [Archangium gephyra]|uniref:FecR protein n=1 Tax=Archangium gephyra TaxID=48 RepID=A0AAC8TC96_9BACT|nr:FecR domain-containing protein [Archangium gephyra]AKJ00568.1 putative lipoprotein [Archangium gephyra]REG32735.1 FecR protein [Archangium gephyra]
MRVLTLTLPLLLLLLGGCGGCDKKPPAGPGAPELAKLIQLQGQVTVQQDAASRPGRTDEPLYPGESVVTGPGSTARVRYVNGTEVEVAENSRFRVNGTPGALTLELEEGRIVSTSPKTGGNGLTVTGRFGRAELVTASEMVFDLREKDPRLTLQYGDIRVLDPQGKPLQVVAGEELALSLSKPRQASTPMVAEELVFTLKPQGGKARVRGAQDSTFSDVAPAQSRELGRGAAFEIPANSSARLSSRSLQVSLAGDTTGMIQEASRRGDQSSYTLKLNRGKARLLFGEGQQSLKLADARGELELKVSEQSTISVSHPEAGATVTVLTGQAELVADGKTTLLKAGEGVRRASESPRAEQASAPQPLLPPDAKGVRVFTDGPGEVGIQVPSASEAPLRVEVAEEPSFREPLLAGRVGADWVRVEPPTRGELHWRFLGEDGTVRAQGSARFQPDRGRSALADSNPKAEVLETGLKATIYFQSAVPSLHFSFEPRPGARSYQLRIYRAADVQTPLLQRVTNQNQYSLEPGTLGEGRYLWYVAALGPGGDELAGGRMNKLELVYDNERRGLALSRPRPGERVGREGIPVEGVVPRGSRLFLNGQAVKLDAKGRFSQRLPATEALVFRLVSGQDEAYWVRTLRKAQP